MGFDINNVTLTGRLTRDCEVRHTPSGSIVVKFSIANSQSSESDRTSFIDCVGFGEFYQNMATTLVKGKQIAIVGRLQQRRWQNDSGQTQSKIEVILRERPLLCGGYDSNRQQQNERPPLDDGMYETPSQEYDDNIPF